LNPGWKTSFWLGFMVGYGRYRYPSVSAQGPKRAMFVLRSLAGVFFLFAAIAIASDVSRSLSGTGGLIMTSFEAHWRAFAPQLLTSTKDLISLKLHPLAWDPGLRRLLLLPAWFLLGALGLIFAHLGRRQRRVNIFIN
jgi:hypothetical protein